MSIQISAGSPAQPRDRRAAKLTRTLLTDELARVRAAALAWRNGLGALLAGLIGFGLLKGRTEVTQLKPGVAALAGALLLAALIFGAIAAVLMMRAAHGRPHAVSLTTVLSDEDDPALIGRLAEADGSQRALSRGVVLSFVCAVFLVAAVAVTWYGPAKDGPRIEVRTVNGSVECGEAVTTASGSLTLKTARGQVTVDLSRAGSVTAVDSCPISGKP
ncbi:hypothetical protein [Lentzea sp. CA-135723]|uniref:hypothetical protein n=1 Tax=Lentzea sp. CA-135723 TaxID=3239950 RepID=UPI003D8D5B63